MKIIELIQVVGYDNALKLCAELGGRTLHVPRRPTAKFIAVIGEDASRHLCREFGGMSIDNFPLMKRENRREYIRRLRSDGVTNSGIADRLGITVRRVRQIANEIAL